MEELARASLGITGMLHKMNAYPDELSGGENAKALLARAIPEPQDTGAG